MDLVSLVTSPLIAFFVHSIKGHIKIMSGGNALAVNRHNSVPCTDKTSRQRSCNQRVLVVSNNWDLEPLDLLNGLALDCQQPSPEVLAHCRGLEVQFTIVYGGGIRAQYSNIQQDVLKNKKSYGQKII